jgi:hypothetical protein
MIVFPIDLLKKPFLESKHLKTQASTKNVIKSFLCESFVEREKWLLCVGSDNSSTYFHEEIKFFYKADVCESLKC